MPAIPQYQQQTVPGGSYSLTGLVPRPVNLEGVERGLGTAIAATEYRRRAEEEKRESDALATAHLEIAKHEATWGEEFARRQLEIEQENADGAEFTPGILEDYDKDVEKRIAEAKTERAKLYMREQFAQTRGRFATQGLVWETNRGFDFRKSQASESADLHIVEMQKNPATFAPILARFGTFLDNVRLRAEDREALFKTVKIKGGLYASESAAERDPYGVLKALKGEGEVPPYIKALDESAEARQQVQSAAEQEIRRREQEAREQAMLASQRRTEEIVRARAQRADALAAASIGRDLPLPSKSYYQAEFGEDADKALALDERRKVVNTDISLAVQLSEEEAVEFLTRKHKPKDEAFSRETVPFFTNVMEAYAAKREAAKKDFVGYLIQTVPEFGAKFEEVTAAAQKAAASNQSPDQIWDAWRITTDSWQARAGIPREERRILPVSVSQSYASSLTYDVENPMANADRIREMGALFGSHRQKIFAEMDLDPSTEIVAGMDEAPARTFAASLKAAPAKLDFIKAPLVKHFVSQEMEPMITALSASPDGFAKATAALTVASTLANHYVLTGLSPGDAAERAVKEVNPNTVYKDRAQIPTVYRGRATDPNSMYKRALKFQDSIDAATLLVTPDPDDPTPSEQQMIEAQRQLAARIDDDGYWTNSSDQEGLELRVDIDGVPRVVHTADGRRIILTWDQLAGF